MLSPPSQRHDDSLHVSFGQIGELQIRGPQVTLKSQEEIQAPDDKAWINTGDLAEIISNAIPVKEKFKHPATRSFQAIRIFINEELQAVEQGLKGAASVLAKGGRLSVISFHSLEDRMVKRFMRDISSRPKLPAGLPVMEADIEVPYRLVGKPVVAGEAELEANPRARSARLRVLERRR